MAEGAGVPSVTGTSKVFISYSRDDLDFADQLAAALEVAGFEAAVDRHEISGGEAWQQRLGSLIRDADTVVFVLSPRSAVSPICSWEVEEATRLGKRILPVVSAPLGDTSPPHRLQDLNYVFFYPEPKSPGGGFGTGLARLVAALHTDLDWVREHTRLLARATEWEKGGRPINRLLSGNDIAEAKAWAAGRPKDAPAPTALHLDFIRASEEEETSRAGAERRRLDEMAAAQDQRAKALAAAEDALERAARARAGRARAQAIIMWGSAGAAVVLGALGLVAWRNSETAERNFAEAETQRKAAVANFAEAEKQRKAAEANFAEAEKQRNVAEENQKVAEQNLREAKITQSRLLVNLADERSQAGDESSRVLLALEALSALKALPGAERGLDKFLGREAADSLKSGLSQLRERALFEGRAALSSDGKFVISTKEKDGSARLWDSSNLRQELLALDPPGQAVKSAAFSPDGRLALTTLSDATARIWDLAARKELFTLGDRERPVAFAAFSPRGAFVLTARGGRSTRETQVMRRRGRAAPRAVRLWDAATGKEHFTFGQSEAPALDYMFSPDDRFILTTQMRKSPRLWDTSVRKEPFVLGDDNEKDRSVDAAFSRDGRRVVTVSSRGVARVWDTATGLLRFLIDDPQSIFVAAAFSPDGERVITGSADGAARIWDATVAAQQLTDHQQLKVLPGHAQAIEAVAFSPDGRFMVTASRGGTRLWDTQKDYSPLVFGEDTIEIGEDEDAEDKAGDDRDADEKADEQKAHDAEVPIEKAFFSPDGRHLLAVSKDKSLRLWDMKTRKKRLALGGA